MGWLSGGSAWRAGRCVNGKSPERRFFNWLTAKAGEGVFSRNKHGCFSRSDLDMHLDAAAVDGLDLLVSQ
jgi:hypothetical protein